jgi:hypothetical protein
MGFRRIAGGMKSTRRKEPWCTCRSWRGHRITLGRDSCGLTRCKTTCLPLQGDLWTSRRLRVTRLLGGELTPRRVSELCESLVVSRLRCPRQGIFKFVGVGAVGDDDDVHCAREAGELIGTGVGNDGYVQRGDTLFMVPMCWRTKLPLRSERVPVIFSIAT